MTKGKSNRSDSVSNALLKKKRKLLAGPVFVASLFLILITRCQVINYDNSLILITVSTCQ